MATATGVPLAEAVVMLKLVSDSGQVKKDIVKSLAPLAGIMAAGTLGVKKYMLTATAGAAKLRYAFAGLSKSWNQFLARLGRVIAGS